MKTYWLRVHCRWVLVTTTFAVWAGTPRWIADVACSAWGWLPVEVAVPSAVAASPAAIAIPEPWSIALLAAGCALLGGLRWAASKA